MAGIRFAPRRAGIALAGLLATGMAFTGLTATAAQDDMEASVSHPGHIHEGTCAELGGVVFPLSNATINGQPEGTEGEVTGNSAGGYAVEASITMDVPASLETILGADHAINFHESEENIQNYIACGNLSGVVVDGTLHVGLAPVGDSGHAGIAILTDNGDDTTSVAVYLSEVVGGMGDMSGMDATPAAEDIPDSTGDPDSLGEGTPEATDDGQVAQEVGMAGLMFEPSELEVTVGTTVTFVNDDTVAHTVTAEDGTFDSGNIDAGSTFEYTFEEPGVYPYFCQYHGGMSGTITVTGVETE